MSFGKMPIANGFLSKNEFNQEFFFDMEIGFSEKCSLFQLKDHPTPEQMFNSKYPFFTGSSEAMKLHFQNYANFLKKNYIKKQSKIVEIGSNDGTFLDNFKDTNLDYIGFEPSSNVAQLANNNGIKTINSFFNLGSLDLIKDFVGQTDVIFAANVICHIPDLIDLIKTIDKLLSKDGVFVFEEPYLGSMFKKTSYDQIYDEHAHVFSVTALNNILRRNGLQIFSVDNLSVHGGSNRIYACHIDSCISGDSVGENLKEEKDFGINNFETYEIFAKRVKESKDELVRCLSNLKHNGKSIISIGATSKSTTVFNYCGIDSSLIDCITDTTPDKQNLLAPGSHIPVVDRESVDLNDYDYALLGAWNFKSVIANKESEFVKNGGQFITHVPKIMMFS